MTAIGYLGQPLKAAWYSSTPSVLRAGQSSKCTLEHLARCSNPRSTSTSRQCRASRSLSTIPSDSLGSSFSMTRHVADQLHLPRFRTNARRMDLIQSPSAFYKAIESMILHAKERIFISSLYIGKDECDLIDCIREALERNKGLKVTILVDGLRSTREGQLGPPTSEKANRPTSTSCASLLASLARDYPNQVDICLYRTPGLPPWMEKLIGKRFVEGAGLQHMKIYGADDDVIVSGANLSHDYFTNRQDRYLRVKGNGLLANYLHSLLLLTCRFSYTLEATHKAGQLRYAYHSPYTLQWNSGQSLLLAEGTGGCIWEGGRLAESEPFAEHRFALAAGRAVRLFTERWRRHTQDREAARRQGLTSSSGEEEATIVPLLQMGPMGIDDETRSMPLILSYIEEQARRTGTTSTLDVTSGYFSLYPPYKRALISLGPDVDTRIIAASPEANGFFGSKGVSGLIPAAYTWLESKFWRSVQQERRQRRQKAGQEKELGPCISLSEWSKSGWTYHAKGMWHRSSTPSSAPVQTLIGSSNLGSRSALRDLECSLLVETSVGSSLDTKLNDEIEALRRFATVEVDEEGSLFGEEERKVSWGVRIATEIIKGRL